MGYPQFILFGDSLLEFSSLDFAAPLQARYSRRLDVINRGLSGYNSSQGLKIIHEVIPSPSVADVKYILVLFGANDACIENSPTRQQVPLEQFEDNIRAIINATEVRAHRAKIILVTPPPIEENLSLKTDAAKGQPLCRRAARTKQFADAVRRVGAGAGSNVVVVDLWNIIMNYALKNSPTPATRGMILGCQALGEDEALKSLMPDGLHLNAKGYKLFFDGVVEAMSDKWPNEGPSSHDYVFPDWKQLAGLPITTQPIAPEPKGVLAERPIQEQKGINIAGDGMGSRKGTDAGVQKSKGINIAGDGMGGRKTGSGRSWGIGDYSDGEEDGGVNARDSAFKRSNPGKAQVVGEQNGGGGDFWNY